METGWVYIGGCYWGMDTQMMRTLHTLIKTRSKAAFCIHEFQNKKELLPLLAKEGVKYIETTILESKEDVLVATDVVGVSKKSASEIKEYPLTEAIFCWDGKSHNTLCNILHAFYLVPVTIITSDKPSGFRPSDIEDVRSCLPNKVRTGILLDEPIPEVEKTRIIDEFIESEAMKAHLANVAMTKRQAKSLILGAPVPISKKLDRLESMVGFDDPLNETIDDYAQGPKELPPYSSWQRASFFSFGSGAFELRSAIHPDPCWDEGYELVEIAGEPTYLYQQDTSSDGEVIDVADKRSAGKADLKISQPFKPGDIVTLDCKPFAKTCHALLLDEAEKSWRMPILYLSESGTWRLSQIGIGRRWGDQHERMSPIYRLTKADEVSPEEELLTELAAAIGKDETTAHKLYQDLQAAATAKFRFGNTLFEAQVRTILKAF